MDKMLKNALLMQILYGNLDSKYFLRILSLVIEVRFRKKNDLAQKSAEKCQIKFRKCTYIVVVQRNQTKMLKFSHFLCFLGM